MNFHYQNKNMALCKYPMFLNEKFFGCGQCHVCRINKRREWTMRLMLEAHLHEKKSFVTLTYNDDNLPADGELVPSDLTKYLKRLRKVCSKSSRRFRYFACGEYGTDSNRPHYHLILYGVDEKETELIGSVWGKGHIFVGSVTPESMQYVCGYVLKKNLKTEKGGHKVSEFSRMSRRPGIGCDVVPRIAEALNIHATAEMQAGGDVPGQLRVNGRLWPIGRYLKSKLRKEMNVDEIQIREINETLLEANAQEKIRELESQEELSKEVTAIKEYYLSGQAGFQTRRTMKRDLMALYNRSRIELSEALAKIYKNKPTGGIKV